jgi:hypothetical protein
MRVNRLATLHVAAELNLQGTDTTCCRTSRRRPRSPSSLAPLRQLLSRAAAALRLVVAYADAQSGSGHPRQRPQEICESLELAQTPAAQANREARLW